MRRVTIEANNNSPESKDFARMLGAMYEAWTGTLAHEAGVHSLTYISPFDVERRRHTTFALVLVDGEADANPHMGPTRRYVLDPYTQVCDYALRRKTTEAHRVLAGDLTPLLEGESWEPTPPGRPVVGRPTEEDVRRAEELAREMGWLTDEGFIWEHEEDE